MKTKREASFRCGGTSSSKKQRVELFDGAGDSPRQVKVAELEQQRL